MRVVVAMSGGVDSSAAAALLQAEGHEVIGITLRVWSYQGAARCGSCCSPEDIEDARAVAETLGIPFYVANAEDLFQEQVVQPFVRSYLRGRTPIPCVSCNQFVKFDFLLRRARALNAKLATGHYARIEREGEQYHLCRGADQAKDQSYFLFTLSQRELSDVLFPVGGLTKAQVREVAVQNKLPVTHKPESMEICFVPDGNYAGFVEKVAGAQASGPIVDREGNVLGAHAGIHRYTVGQRRGLNLSHPLPLYVEKIDPAANRLVVGPASNLERSDFQVVRPHWVGQPPTPDRAVEVKIRHGHAPTPARLSIGGDGQLTVRLKAPARAVTPGQAAVFYERDRVLGGGWIS